MLPLFLAGLILGIAAMNLGRSLLLENTGLLDEYSLYHMKYMTVDSNTFFLFVLKERLGCVALLAVMATTYLGLAVTGGFLLWYGAAAGMYLSALVLRYGIKGIFFALTGMFPHYLLYVPAMLCILIWCEGTCRSIYFQGGVQPADGGMRIPGRLLRLGVLVMVVIIGCALESYVNPSLMYGLLKIF